MPIWPTRRAPSDARFAAARCIPPAIRANRGAGPVGSGPSTTGASASAVRRFPATPFWQVARAAFVPPIDHERLPASLLERFTGDDADRLVALLRFIGPVTGGRVHAR